jgi:hypothetical protein
MQSIAAVRYPRKFEIDLLFADVCKSLLERGVRVGGVIQTITPGIEGQCAASIQVIDVRSEAVFNVWENRGLDAKGCRLNEAGLLEMEPTLLTAIEDRVDLLLVNRFGRAESLGRGLIGCFAAAIDAKVPILTAVRVPYDIEWQRFHGGMGVELPPDLSSILQWFELLLAAPQEGPQTVEQHALS